MTTDTVKYAFLLQVAGENVLVSNSPSKIVNKFVEKTGATKSEVNFSGVRKAMKDGNVNVLDFLKRAAAGKEGSLSAEIFRIERA